MAITSNTTKNRSPLFSSILFTHPIFENPLNVAIRNFFIVVFIAAVLILPATLDQDIHNFVFPEARVILSNEGSRDILYMCQGTNNGGNLKPIPPNKAFHFGFRIYAYPMRWCYVYINPETHGFFWAFNVKSRCVNCFWKIDSHVSLFREDRGRWERRILFLPSGFNISTLVNPTI